MLTDMPMLKGEVKTERKGKLPTADGPRWWWRIDKGLTCVASAGWHRQRLLPLMHNVVYVGGVGEDGGDLGYVYRLAYSTAEGTKGRSGPLNQNHHVRFRQLQKDRPLQSAHTLHRSLV